VDQRLGGVPFASRSAPKEGAVFHAYPQAPPSGDSGRRGEDESPPRGLTRNGTKDGGATDITPDGDQAVTPGAERAPDRDVAEQEMNKPMKGKPGQKAADDGLFDTGARSETDIFDTRPPAPAAKPATPPVVATFTTAKGSAYQVHADGTTTRNKAARDQAGHEGDSGAKPRSEMTIYLDENAASLSIAGLRTSHIPGYAAVVVVNEESRAGPTQCRPAQQMRRVIPSARVRFAISAAPDRAALLFDDLLMGTGSNLVHGPD
jgi:hypothetical protein